MQSKQYSSVFDGLKYLRAVKLVACAPIRLLHFSHRLPHLLAPRLHEDVEAAAVIVTLVLGILEVNIS